MSTDVVFGFGGLQQLSRLLEIRGSHRVLLVTGRESYERSGAAATLAPLLSGRVVGRFCEFSPNPKMDDVDRGVAACRAASPDMIIAVGGGTVLDMGKLVSAFATQKTGLTALATGRLAVAACAVPLVAIPTTSGSGSEATHFAVVYIDRVKHSVASSAMRPVAAFVDPTLTFSLDPRTTAVTGLDAFAQAVESYWSIHSTRESKALAREAISLVLRYLTLAVRAPTPRARWAMSRAAHLAGRAIDITKTTGAHAVSYPLTSHFGIQHGHAVSLTLGRWLVFNSEVTDEDVTDPRGAAYVRQAVDEIVQMLGCRTPAECGERIEDLVAGVGLETRLRALGVSSADVAQVVIPNVNAERVANNPRAMTAGNLKRIVEAVC